MITAGPTWVKLDKVRVISNRATGENGITLAEEALKHKAKVTLLLGPVKTPKLNKKIRVLKFAFFNDLKNTLLKELQTGKYDCLIHSAAVSDYEPDKTFKTKVSSGKTSWKINLVPTPKIIDLTRKIAPELFLVGFKFEPDAQKKFLLKKANDFIRRSGSNLAVANTLLNDKKYLAYITDGKNIKGPFVTKKKLCLGLIKLLEQFYEKQ